jgi:type IV fimbrial biogenesis protein FimT
MRRGSNGRLHKIFWRQHGFSLIELMVIIAILGTLSAIAIPNYISYRDNTRLRAGANEMLALFRKAQVNAVKQHYNAVLDFNTAGEVTVYLDNGAGGTGTANNSTQETGEPTLDQYTVPIGCSLANTGSFNGKVAGFTQRGLPVGLDIGSIIILSANASAQYRVSLSLAGHTSIDVSTDGGSSWQ